jgi:transketolase
MALEAITAASPNLVLGSAGPDAVHQHQDQGPTGLAGSYAGRYIHYGIREHGMAAAMNGIAITAGSGRRARPSWSSRITRGPDPHLGAWRHPRSST